MNNISFQGRSTLVLNPKAYDKARELTSGAYRHLRMDNNCRLINGKIYTSKADAQNLAVIVRNEKDGILKFVPTKGEIQQVLDEISKKVDTLKAASKGKLTAWIIGGEAIKSPNGGKTVDAVNKIADIICDRPDIDTSILAGSLKGEEKIVLHTRTNLLEIILDKFVNGKTPKSKFDEKDLSKYFDIVELNNTDVSAV